MQRFKQAVLISLPVVTAYLVVYFFLVHSDRYGQSMAFALFFGLPIVVIGLPWSILGGFIEPTFREWLPYRAMENIAHILYVISFIFNAYWFLRYKPYEVLMRWSSILCGSQVVLFLMFGLL